MYRIGIDVGGTFTDLVAIDGSGEVTLAKAPSTPADPSLGVMAGLSNLAHSANLELHDLLRQTERVVHGTTVATNALIERKGAKVGLLTTAGHRDVLEMREGLKPERYNLRLAPPEPLVPRHLRLGVAERLRADGRIETPLNQRSLVRAIATLKSNAVDAVAVCYLHAYRDPRHERATGAELSKRLPDVYVSLSSEVLPQIKEYERVATTVVNAYVGRRLEGYLKQLEARLAEAGCTAPVLIMQSHGGVVPIREAVRIAAGSVLSGPAGGVAASQRSSRQLQAPDLIAFDMGGTSTDISMIVNGEPTLSADRSIAGQRIALPSLDIVTLGAGGGSIAEVDTGGVLHVGPRSAGADPGPACYGRGGTEPTVTDANLALGYLDEGNFLGGSMALDPASSESALDRLGKRLGLGRIATAAGVHRLVNTRMAEGIRLISVRRGVDPRRFALFSFGGAAGIHITELARALEIGRVVVPAAASVLSAWGMLASDLRFEVSRTHIADTASLNDTSLRSLYAEMEAEARQRMKEWFKGRIEIRRLAEMRYGEQVFEIEVPLDNVRWRGADLLGQVREEFHRRHEERFTYALRDQDVVLVNARVAAIGAISDLKLEAKARRGKPGRPRAHRRVFLSRWRRAPVYDLASLAPGQRIEGPAIVETETTTVLLRAGDAARVTPHHWLDIKVGKKK